ncbi:unnamed protein product, partial [Musa textilis]
LRHRSLSFGSRHACSNLNPSQKIGVGRRCNPSRGFPPISFLVPSGFPHPLTHTHVRLLGLCFKMGRMGSPLADAQVAHVPRGAHRWPASFPRLHQRIGRNLLPDWGCIPKQPDSSIVPRGVTWSEPDGARTLPGAPFQGTWARSITKDASPYYNLDNAAARFSS